MKVYKPNLRTIISLEEPEVTEKDFLFGARKPLFLGMRRFRFCQRLSRILLFLYSFDLVFFFRVFLMFFFKFLI